MNFSIFTYGDKIEKFLQDGIKEYEKRLSRYCKINAKLFKNTESLQKSISNKKYVVVVTSMNTDMISSEELASKIEYLALHGNSDVTFVVGTSDIKADETIALSSFQISSGLTTMILYEQVYRAYRIINNEPYHK